MTVCIGTLCENRHCVILAADRMVTSGLAIEFEHPVSNKITKLSENCLALTAGNALVYTELFNAVCHATSNKRFTSVEEFVEAIKEMYQALRRKQIEERFLMPRSFRNFQEFYQAQPVVSESIVFMIQQEIERFNYGLDILVGGVTGDAAHLYNISDPGTSQCYDSLGFQAIGSGMNLALSSLIGSGCHQDLSLAEALLTTVSAKMHAENAPGVGRRTDVSLIRPGQPCVHFSDDQIKRLKELAREGSAEGLETVDGIVSAAAGRNTGLPQSRQPTIIPRQESEEVEPLEGDENDRNQTESGSCPEDSAVESSSDEGEASES